MNTSNPVPIEHKPIAIKMNAPEKVDETKKLKKFMLNLN